MVARKQFGYEQIEVRDQEGSDPSGMSHNLAAFARKTSRTLRTSSSSRAMQMI